MIIIIININLNTEEKSVDWNRTGRIYHDGDYKTDPKSSL
jgi:hypothetical protein